MTPTDTTDAAPGIDLPRVSVWLGEHVPEMTAPFLLSRIGDGRSNLTYRVQDAADRQWILRRPPVGPKLPSAHDMVREYRLIAALHPTGVPVPRPYGLCQDDAVTGAPFYVMEHVQGRVLASKEDAAPLTPAARRTAGLSLVDAVARLHAVDVAAVGLADLARHENYGARQLRRWSHQWQASRTRELPAIDRVHALLSEAIPPQEGVAIVHGDYKLENVVVNDDGEVQAILDWELCTLGDPLADLGLLLVYWNAPDEQDDRLGTVTLAGGFPTREELVARYAQTSERDLSGLPFYCALGAWKLAIILQGVVRRFRDTPENANVDPATLEPLIDRLAADAERIAEGLADTPH